MSMIRVQVMMTEEERERFRDRANREGMSLSAWLRRAGRDLLSQERPGRMTPDQLEAFFQACDEREGDGVEPDWEVYKEMIHTSKMSGILP